MIIDARQVVQDETINCDICIVGAGAAGITLAHELRDSGMEVVLLESGGWKVEDHTRDLNKGEVLEPKIHEPLEEKRRRCFGGATIAWGGRCVPFDEVDFEARPYVPYSGWPITKRDLDSYYMRAHAYCEIGAYTYDVKAALSMPERQKSLIPNLKSEDISLENLALFSPPTNFGKKFRDRLKESSNIKIYLYANCLKISTNQEGNNVDFLRVGSWKKNFLVCAKHYILATGALEVARILLLSNDVHYRGIGNHNDMLGRFYMCHFNSIFEVELTSPDIIWDFEKTVEGVYCQRIISINKEKQKQHKLLNSRIYLWRPDMEEPIHGRGVLSAVFLAKAILRRNLYLPGLFDYLKNILFDFKSVLCFSKKWIDKKIISERKLPSVILKSNSNIHTLRIDAEQAPNPNSRVALSNQRDAFGLNRLKVDWQYTDLDVESIMDTAQLIEQALIKSGAGKIRSLPSLTPSILGHHIGTTRMASSPSQGVVDENCKVHGLNNLYIASSSVFPTSSYANPTLTIVAMAIRLADYLKVVSR